MKTCIILDLESSFAVLWEQKFRHESSWVGWYVHCPGACAEELLHDLLCGPCCWAGDLSQKFGTGDGLLSSWSDFNSLLHLKEFLLIGLWKWLQQLALPTKTPWAELTWSSKHDLPVRRGYLRPRMRNVCNELPCKASTCFDMWKVSSVGHLIIFWM